MAFDNGVKHLREVYQTTDGKIFGTKHEADHHQDVVIKQQAINRLKDCLKYSYSSNITASVLENMITDCGFVYDPKNDVIKGSERYETVKKGLLQRERRYS